MIDNPFNKYPVSHVRAALYCSLAETDVEEDPFDRAYSICEAWARHDVSRYPSISPLIAAEIHNCNVPEHEPDPNLVLPPYDGRETNGAYMQTMTHIREVLERVGKRGGIAE